MKKKNQPTSEDVVTEVQLQNAETISETKTETNAETPVENPEEPQEENPAETPLAESSGETSAENSEEGETRQNAAVDMEARLAEAENRGYLRGRNERIAELMREPAMFERQNLPTGCHGFSTPASSDWQGDSKPMILNSPHVSIWDK